MLRTSLLVAVVSSFLALASLQVSPETLLTPLGQILAIVVGTSVAILVLILTLLGTEDEKELLLRAFLSDSLAAGVLVTWVVTVAGWGIAQAGAKALVTAVVAGVGFSISGLGLLVRELHKLLNSGHRAHVVKEALRTAIVYSAREELLTKRLWSIHIELAQRLDNKLMLTRPEDITGLRALTYERDIVLWDIDIALLENVVQKLGAGRCWLEFPGTRVPRGKPVGWVPQSMNAYLRADLEASLLTRDAGGRGNDPLNFTLNTVVNTLQVGISRGSPEQVRTSLGFISYALSEARALQRLPAVNAGLRVYTSIRQHLYTALRAVARSRNRALYEVALFSIHDTLRDAVEAGDLRSWGDSLEFYRWFYEYARLDEAPDDLLSFVRSRVYSMPSESLFFQFRGRPDLLEVAGVLAFRHYGEVFRGIMKQSLFSEGLELLQALPKIAANIKGSVADHLNLTIYAWAMWVLYLHGNGEVDDDFLSVYLGTTCRLLRSMDAVTRAFRHAVEAKDRDEAFWEDWQQSHEEGKSAVQIGFGSWFCDDFALPVRAYCVLGIILSTSAKPRSAVIGNRILASMANSEVRGVGDALNSVLSSMVAPKTLREAIDDFMAYNEAMARFLEEQERDRVARSPVSPELIEATHAEFETAWRGETKSRSIFAGASLYREVPFASVGLTTTEMAVTLPKDMFVDGSGPVSWPDSLWPLLRHEWSDWLDWMNLRDSQSTLVSQRTLAESLSALMAALPHKPLRALFSVPLPFLLHFRLAGDPRYRPGDDELCDTFCDIPIAWLPRVMMDRVAFSVFESDALWEQGAIPAPQGIRHVSLTVQESDERSESGEPVVHAQLSVRYRFLGKVRSVCIPAPDG